MLGLVMFLMMAACGPTDPMETENATETTDITIQESEEIFQETETSAGDKNQGTIDITGWGDPTVELGGDWNGDRSWDQLRVYDEDLEGSLYTTGLQLNISGKKPYVFQAPWDVSYEDFLKGDFDGDGDLEYAFVFDIHAQGANGGCGMVIVDYADGQWVEITQQEPFLFTGFSYEVVSDEGGWYHIIGQESGQEHMVQGEEIPETDVGTVTPFWLWAVVEGETQDYLQIWQYAAGGHKINQIGDVVTTFGVKDGQLEIVDEFVSQDLIMYDGSMAKIVGRNHSMAELGGAYYVRLINPAGMVLECATEHEHYEELKRYEKFWVPFHSQETLFLSTKIEPVMELQVLCSYEELVQHWDPEQLYEIVFHIDRDRLTITTAKQIASEQTISGRWDGPLYQVLKNGDRLEILPIEYVKESNTKRLDELAQQGWDLEKLFFDDIYHHYMVEYETERQMVQLTEDTRYYGIDSYGIVRATEDEMYFCEDDIRNSGDYRIVVEQGKVVCILLHLAP